MKRIKTTKEQMTRLITREKWEAKKLIIVAV